MSAQDPLDIPIEAYHDQQSLRFLELPPQLLELLTTKRPSHLYLKSATSDHPDDSARGPASVVLCTDDQTYQVRQVQSSNSHFILHPSESTVASEDVSVTSASLTALAQCPVTLELVPISPSPAAFLRQSLPIYAGPDSLVTLDSSSKANRATILENAPFSAGEYDKAWRALCSFELEGQAWRPSTSLLAIVWKSIIAAATVRSLDLAENFAVDALSGAVEEDGHPRVLVHAIISTLGSKKDRTNLDEFARLDREKCVVWVGTTFLESQQTFTDGIPSSDFIQDWRNQLPESWRSHAEMDLLKGKFTQLPGNRIIFDQKTGRTTNSDSIVATSANSKNTRKWHEKFKNARR